MALSDNPRSVSLLLLLLAVLAGYVGWSGDGINLIGASGLRNRSERVNALQDTLAVLQTSIDSAKRELALGSVEEVQKRAEQYRATLDLLRQLDHKINK